MVTQVLPEVSPIGWRLCCPPKPLWEIASAFLVDTRSLLSGLGRPRLGPELPRLSDCLKKDEKEGCRSKKLEAGVDRIQKETQWAWALGGEGLGEGTGS